ncbi:hypothetical protein O3M35_001544 [Rhynocoris fuscipes]|uniref:Neprilysin n=1 Tax=Rhynocoris fuscipes TaxID=488301 RepID=A0AAW1CP18_9HEMI
MMDFSTDPCEDFYKFSCGQFLKIDAPKSVSTLSVFTLIKNSVIEEIQKVLDEPVKRDERIVIANVKNLYKLCINRNDQSREDSLNYLKSLLDRLGGWPVVEGESWDEDSFDWMKLMKIFNEEGLSLDYLFTISIGNNLQNSTKKMLEIDEADTILDGRVLDENIKSSNVTKSYHKFMVDIAVLLGADRIYAEDELWAAVTFEGALSKSKYISENSKEFLYYSLKEMNEKFEGIPWLEFIKLMFTNTSVEITEEESVSILNEGFISHAHVLIQSAPKSVLGNYLIWRLVHYFIENLPEKFTQSYLEYKKSSMMAHDQPEWVYCLSQVTQLYPFPVSYLYVNNYFDEEAKEAATEIVNEIKKVVKDSLSWMDNASKKEALKKLDAMESYVGYPDELKDLDKLQSYYGDLTVNSTDNYLLTYLKINKELRKIKYDNFRSLLNKKDWKRHAEVIDVNAFYSVVDNSIYLPAGILQGSFFGKSRPKYANYGGIGYVTGHEMIHAYDIQGSLFDSDGNMRDWWTPESKKIYLEKANCVADQFSNYRVMQVDETLSGQRTASENLADCGGLHAAYVAYTKKCPDEPKLIGFEQFSPKQMFWISAANVWCTIYRDDMLLNLIRDGEHCPGEFRVNGAFANQLAFSKDFNCTIGSKMNPEKKCLFLNDP